MGRLVLVCGPCKAAASCGVTIGAGWENGVTGTLASASCMNSFQLMAGH
jgi:hypothetical protein